MIYNNFTYICIQLETIKNRDMNTSALLIVTGRLGRDCKQEFTADGKAYVILNVCHDVATRDNTTNEWKETPFWVQATYWGDLKEGVNLFRKGATVQVQGEPAINLYQSRDGQYRADQRIRCQTRPSLIAFAPRTEETVSATASPEPPVQQETKKDDLPF